MNASRPWEGFAVERCEMELGPADPCAIEWLNSGSGPYGEAGASVMVRYKSSVSQNDNIDVWLFGATNVIIRGFYPGYSNRTISPTSWAMSMIKVNQPGQTASGTVKLASADPRAPPVIEFNWLEGESGERDLQALTEAAGLFERSFAAAPEEMLPTIRNQPPEDEDVAQNLKDEAFGHHASSTCRSKSCSPRDRFLEPLLIHEESAVMTIMVPASTQVYASRASKACASLMRLCFRTPQAPSRCFPSP